MTYFCDIIPDLQQIVFFCVYSVSSTNKTYHQDISGVKHHNYNPLSDNNDAYCYGEQFPKLMNTHLILELSLETDQITLNGNVIFFSTRNAFLSIETKLRCSWRVIQYWTDFKSLMRNGLLLQRFPHCDTNKGHMMWHIWFSQEITCFLFLSCLVL